MLQITAGTKADLKNPIRYRSKLAPYRPQVEKAIRTMKKKNDGDASIYFGALNIRRIAENAGIDLAELQTPKKMLPPEVIRNKKRDLLRTVYQGYLMGLTGSGRFKKLDLSESVDQNPAVSGKGLSRGAITKNPKLFLWLEEKAPEGPAVTRAEAQRRLNNRIFPALQAAEDLLKKK